MHYEYHSMGKKECGCMYCYDCKIWLVEEACQSHRKPYEVIIK